ncbi:MAG: hypothetical protein U1F11_02860 [Steroidobacteraceae bacterium]
MDAVVEHRVRRVSRRHLELDVAQRRAGLLEGRADARMPLGREQRHVVAAAQLRGREPRQRLAREPDREVRLDQDQAGRHGVDQQALQRLLLGDRGFSLAAPREIRADRDDARHAAGRRVAHRLVHRRDPAHRAIAANDTQVRLGCVARRDACPQLPGAITIRGVLEDRPAAERPELGEVAAIDLAESRAGPDGRDPAGFIDLGLDDVAARDLGGRAIVSFAGVHALLRELALVDVERAAEHAQRLAGGGAFHDAAAAEPPAPAAVAVQPAHLAFEVLGLAIEMGAHRLRCRGRSSGCTQSLTSASASAGSSGTARCSWRYQLPSRRVRLFSMSHSQTERPAASTASCSRPRASPSSRRSFFTSSMTNSTAIVRGRLAVRVRRHDLRLVHDPQPASGGVADPVLHGPALAQRLDRITVLETQPAVILRVDQRAAPMKPGPAPTRMP